MKSIRFACIDASLVMGRLVRMYILSEKNMESVKQILHNDNKTNRYIQIIIKPSFCKGWLDKMTYNLIR